MLQGFVKRDLHDMWHDDECLKHTKRAHDYLNILHFACLMTLHMGELLNVLNFKRLAPI